MEAAQCCMCERDQSAHSIASSQVREQNHAFVLFQALTGRFLCHDKQLEASRDWLKVC